MTDQGRGQKREGVMRAVSMCEGCEQVPVPVHFLNRGHYRGMYVCSHCLAEEGIHLDEEDFAQMLTCKSQNSLLKKLPQ